MTDRSIPRQALRARLAFQLVLAAALAGPAAAAGAAEAGTLIRDVILIDGTGAPGRAAAVRIAGDRIVEVGALERLDGEAVVEGSGRVLAPGFIDSHSHHDRGMFQKRHVEAASSQGITTVIVGQDGGSRIPLRAFIEEFDDKPTSINFGSYTGHNSLRGAVMQDDGRRPATESEIAAMKKLLAADMASGSFGLSTGLGYETGVFSTTEEVVELARTAAAHDGRYISHIRNENVKVFEAIEEAISIGRRASIPVQISHIKLGAMSTWGQTERVIRLLNDARAESIEVSADIYPYTYWQTTMGILFPEKNYDDPAGIRWAFDELLPPENVLLAVYESEPDLAGKTIAEIAAARGQDPVRVYVDLMQQAIAWGEGNDGRGESIIGTSMAEEDVAELMQWPHANICSDGASAGGHPRGYGSFTRVLAHYVREKGVLTLPEAIHKMTGLTASHLNVADRGTITPGAYADLVLFDPATVEDRARIGNSDMLSTGILKVWVNGRLVFADGRSTGVFAGRFIAPDSHPGDSPQVLEDSTSLATCAEAPSKEV